MRYFYILTLLLVVTAEQNLSAQLSATLNSSNPSCGANNGTITAVPGGGSTYTYKWNTGAATASISNLAGGTYTVTVYSTSGSGTTNWDSIYYESFDSTVETWSINIASGTNGNAYNYWDISDSCVGNGAIGTCVNNTYSPAAGSNKSLYITAQPNGFGLPQYAGARYDAGGLCSFLSFCTNTNMAAQSPGISTNGVHNLVLSFQYTAGGAGLNDNASLLYSINGGTSFTILDPSLKSNNNASCNADGDEEGTWAYASYVLPSTCNNINGLVIRFNWTNDGNADANATDPSIAVDNVTIRDSVPGTGGTIDSVVKTVTLTAITPPSINLGPVVVTKATCAQNNGAISGVNVSGGTQPFTYKWTSGGNTVGTAIAISGLASGSYNLLVTDSNGCTTNATVNVPSFGGAAIVSTGLVVTNESCGLNNGSIIGLTTAGGVAPVTVKWVNSSNATVSQTDTLKNAAAGTYTFIVTDSAGCTNDTSFTLTGTNAPTIPAIAPAQDSLCSGDSVTICPTPQNYSHYAWSDGDTSSCTTTMYAGNYYLTITDVNGCTAVSNISAIATYLPQPVTISQSGDTLTSYSAITYQWYLNGNAIAGATSAVYIATAPGLYTVQVTDVHGCQENSSPATIAGINELAGDIDFWVYPNPVNDNLVQIITDAKSIGQTLEIYDAEGRCIYAAKVSHEKTEIELANLATGMYLVKIGLTVRKIVK